MLLSSGYRESFSLPETIKPVAVTSISCNISTNSPAFSERSEVICKVMKLVEPALIIPEFITNSKS